MEILGRKTEKRVVFRALCKTSNRSSLARGVDVRVVGPLGQVASHIASHMVRISPHCPRPPSNWQVMYRRSGLSPPPSLLASYPKKAQRCGGGDGGGGDCGSELGTAPQRGPMLTLYTAAGFTKVFISGASPPLLPLLFLLPSAVEGKSKLELIPKTLFNLIAAAYTHPRLLRT